MEALQLPASRAPLHLTLPCAIPSPLCFAAALAAAPIAPRNTGRAAAKGEAWRLCNARLGNELKIFVGVRVRVRVRVCGEGGLDAHACDCVCVHA
jgi:hypothetical protein